MIWSIIFMSMLFLSGRSELLTWNRHHQTCSMDINMAEFGGLQDFGSRNAELNFTCNDNSYLTYMRGIIKENSPSEYYTSIFQAIVDMYTDLDDARKPRIFSLDNSNSKKMKLSEPYSSNTVLIHPISFCIPEEHVLRTVPAKVKPFGRVIPGMQSTYFDLVNETQYYEDMEQSLFAITFKKGGWDCLRHLEILASGSLPLFPNIKHCPHQTLTAHPKKVYQLLLKFPGLDLQATRTGLHTMSVEKLALSPPQLDSFGSEAYGAITAALLQYTRNVLTTKAMAMYVLQTMKNYSKGMITSANPRLVLYLTHQDHDMDKGDYMTDFLLHGLRAVLGHSAIVDFPRRDGLYKTAAELNRTSYLARRQQLYGGGFTWGLTIDDPLGTIRIGGKSGTVSDQNKAGYVPSREPSNVRRGIEEGHFDMIILGSGHRDGWASKLHFWDLVCKHYSPLKVGFVDGSDKHLPRKLIERYSPCAGHLFSREGYVD